MADIRVASGIPRYDVVRAINEYKLGPEINYIY